ncbi:MAG: FkbM family methyltransferase [Parvularculaceae bacterium]|nr:FkbM family methyltransferase [Parvularculaceae bacterium]
MTLAALAARLPSSLEIVLADVGSAGGLHRRWAPVRRHVRAVLFDPLDQSAGAGRDLYIPVALAGARGRAAIHVTKRASMTSALLPNTELLKRFWDKEAHTEIERSFEAPTDTLDKVVAENGLKLDALKIDVQGGEYDILLGAQAALNDVFLAEIETSFFERYLGLRTFDAVIALMRERGFDLVDISRIKRYRYRNSAGVVNPGLGLGDRAGRIAFCDAIFLARDETLARRIEAEGADFTLKLMVTLLVYGKADMAAHAFDQGAARLPSALRDDFARYFKSVSGVGFSLKRVHRAVDYLARKV